MNSVIKAKDLKVGSLYRGTYSNKFFVLLKYVFVGEHVHIQWFSVADRQSFHGGFHSLEEEMPLELISEL